MSTTHIWLIRAITNLHAGSGDSDFGIVDKHVQRDPVTGLPVVHASSLKGAMRDACDDDAILNKANRDEIFGTENKGGKNENLIQGKYRFFSAKLLALPVRSSEDFYYVATCPELLDDFVKDAKIFDAPIPKELVDNIEKLKAKKPEPGKPHRYGGSARETRLEDWSSVRQEGESGLEALLGERVAVLNATDFKTLSDELPIIARNNLENGISVNLWYEQVVPREARFYCPMYCPDTRLESAIKDHLRYLVQIGGNATVGYGLSRFTKL